MNLNDLIQGEKFINISDFIFDIQSSKYENYYKLQNTFDINSINYFYKIPIIYSHLHLIDEFWESLFKINREFILITHNSDFCLDDRELPKNMIKWFSQNVNCVNEKIESIPIGLENNRWFPEINKKQVILNKIKEEKKERNLLYINHSIWTYKLDREEPYFIFNNKNWCTLVKGRNGFEYRSYVDDIYNHKFVLSPRGNGIDTHRLWETLYLGSIPIEKRNLNNNFYEDLPILFVDDWKEVTEDFLNNKYEEIKGRDWNLEKLKFDYWKNKIQEYENKCR